MAVLPRVADVLTQKLPKILPSKVHLAADYAIAGSFVAAGTWFWRRNRRAAWGALLCGGSACGLALLTSYPGRERRVITFPLHGKLEIGLAALIATMPEFLHFERDPEKKFFLVKAGILTAVSNLTCFSTSRVRRVRSPKAS